MSGFDPMTPIHWLGTYAIHSTVLIGLVWAACRVFPRVGHGTRDLAWKLALVGGLMSATIQVGVGLRPLGPSIELGLGPGDSEAAELEVARVEPAPALAPAHPHDIELATLESPSRPVLAPVLPVPVSDGESSAAARVDTALLGLGAWLLVASVLLGRLALGYRRLHATLAGRVPVDDPRTLAAFERVRAAAGIVRPVVLSACARVSSPIALATDEICVGPRAFASLSTIELESVLAHELAHVRRRDPSWLALAALIEAVFFFQPLNRLARRGMQESAEFLCDDRAVAWVGSGLALARSLAEVARWRGQAAVSPLVAAMVRGEGALVRRVGRLLDDGRQLEREPGRGWTAGVAVSCIAALVALVPGMVRASGPRGEENDDLTVIVVGDDDQPHVIHVDPSQLERELERELGILDDGEDEGEDGERAGKRRGKRAKHAKRAKKSKRARRDHVESPKIVIVPRVHVPEIHVPEIPVPPVDVVPPGAPVVPGSRLRIVVPPTPPMPPGAHPEEWKQWEREVEREMKKMEKEIERELQGSLRDWQREHARAQRDREWAEEHRERAQRDREWAEQHRERAQRDRERAGADHEQHAIERRLLEEAERAQREAEAQQRRAEQLREKAEQLRKRREAGGGVERL